MTDTEPQPQQQYGQTVPSSAAGGQTNPSAQSASKSNSNDPPAPRQWGRRGSGR